MRSLIFSLLFVFAGSLFVSVPVEGQAVVVQPGAPGKATRKLPADARPSLPASSVKDVEFMQGMIMHHAQAVDMTALIADRTNNRDIRLLGERISKSQEDEMAFMRRWLEIRGQATEMKMADSQSHGGHGHGGHGSPDHLMPGMLTPKQMQELKEARGKSFDELFLKGMIQHHEGALVMVKDLHNSPGTAQDAELFNFASDVDSGQRAEIKTMQNLLSRFNVEKKP